MNDSLSLTFTTNTSSNYSITYGSIECFELEKKIGKGQFSEVYRAKCLTNEETVALKKIQVLNNNFIYILIYF